MAARVRRQRLSARAVVVDSGRILLARISPRAYAGAGAWTLPGGGVDHGEHPEDTILREVLEETGLEVRVDGVIGVFSRHFVGRAPGGVLEDYHGVHLIFRAVALDPAQTPTVTEVEGTTDAARWIDVDQVLSGGFPVSDVVRYGLSLPISED
jgi:ADP-ribose pyrophosphatase YjhB (NUDIX family)